MNRLSGKVALVTGASRGQGRSRAVHLADQGAGVIAIDICADIPSNPYALASREDLDETARLIEKPGQRVLAAVADVRDQQAMKSALDGTVAQSDGIHVVVANAGICPRDYTLPTKAFSTRSTSTSSAWSTRFIWPWTRPITYGEMKKRTAGVMTGGN